MRSVVEGNADGHHAQTYRRCLRDPIPEIFRAAEYLRDAVSAHRAGDRGMAANLFRAANMPAIRAWTESIWGKQSREILQSRPAIPKDSLIPKALRTPEREPPLETRKALIAKFGHQCAFCGIPLISAEVRKRAVGLYPEAVSWGRTNQSQHAAFQALWLQFDHVLPHARGGDHSLENLLVTCASCNFGRMNYTLEELGLADPRLQPLEKIDWDGLEAFR